MPTQEDGWDELGRAESDVLVIGGGIVGAGIARDAARRGLRVTLCEMNDLAYGTSSRSSKLVHGGLRYLEQYEFGMVFESVSERRTLMDLAPHLVNPLGFLFPVFEGDRRPLFLINAGMWLYDGLALFRAPKRHRNLKPKDVATLEPALAQQGLQGAPLYFDCSTDDARLTLETALDAAKAGARIVTRAKVKALRTDAHGRVIGAQIEDMRAPSDAPITQEVRAKVVINATGPWSDHTRGLSDAPGAQIRAVLRPTKGVHLVVDAAKLPLNHAVVCFHPDDARVLFVLPWGDRVYVGTTDTDHEGDPSEVRATHEDVAYLIRAVARYFPAHPIRMEDVISTWAGLRPLVAPPREEALSESAISREHEILVGQGGMITIAGGKLTTYRKMAAEVLDRAIELLKLGGQLPKKLRGCDTDRAPLPGGEGWPEDDDHDRVAAMVSARAGGAISAVIARHLTDTYGMRALALADRIAADPSLGAPLIEGRPEIWAQVDVAIEEEFAYSVTDVLLRRTQIFYRDHDQGLGCAAQVAARVAQKLGKPERWAKRSLKEYQEEVERSRSYRLASPQ